MNAWRDDYSAQNDRDDARADALGDQYEERIAQHIRAMTADELRECIDDFFYGRKDMQRAWEFQLRSWAQEAISEASWS
jgi:hypothetical protein